jgi:eukaryotic-like serine/threonine-protein kinase
VVSWAVPGFSQERELGRGASGRVVAAIRAADGQRVAIKYLSPRLLGDPQFLAAFRAEAALLRSLDVPFVVRLLDYVEVPGTPAVDRGSSPGGTAGVDRGSSPGGTAGVDRGSSPGGIQGAAIVMELVDGVSLHDMITRQGPGGPESALAVLKGSLLGLATAHALGIVHRDYKPENVLVNGAGQSKLTDFGVAVRAGQDAGAGGTPLYMAPEQWDGGPATPATDIYAATAVFFECLTGMTPFSGPLGQLAAQHAAAAVPVELVDEPLRELIARGMAKDPAARPGDAAQFMTELEATAEAAYGADWEARGRSRLAERAAALLLLLLPHGVAATGAGTGTTTTSTWLPAARTATRAGGRKTAILAGSAAGVILVGAGIGVALASSHHPASLQAELTGSWVGSYTCSQGLTGLRLDIQAAPGGSATATFNFYAVPSNPGVPSGKYTMTGTYSATGIKLSPSHWVIQPSGYEMVGLNGGPLTHNGNTLSGTVVTCTTFTVTKAS